MLLIWISRPAEQVISALVIAALVMAGMIYCIRASGRKRTNTKAALALAALLGAWLVISGGFAALGAQPSPILLIILSLTVFAVIVTGALLAILALIELGRELLPRDGRSMAFLS